MANALLRIESYIQLGEPEIRNYMQHMYYGRALACFPKESEEYKKIKADDLYNTISRVWNPVELLASVSDNKEIRIICDKSSMIFSEYFIELAN